MIALTASRIHFIHVDITHNDKICDLAGKKTEFLCNLIGCEAQEEAD